MEGGDPFLALGCRDLEERERERRVEREREEERKEERKKK